MIHHYLTEDEINHLNELHIVNKCSSCTFFSRDHKEMCHKRNIGVYTDAIACDLYIKISDVECIYKEEAHKASIDTLRYRVKKVLTAHVCKQCNATVHNFRVYTKYKKYIGKCNIEKYHKILEDPGEYMVLCKSCGENNARS